MIAGAALLLAYWVHCRCTMPLVRARSAGRDGDDVSTQYRTLYGPDVGPDYGDFFTSDWDTMHLHYTHSI